MDRQEIEQAVADSRVVCKSPDGWWFARPRGKTIVFPDGKFFVQIAWKKRCKGVIGSESNCEWKIVTA